MHISAYSSGLACSGDTAIRITYNGRDIQGSPFPVTVQAEPHISTALSTVNVAVPAKGVASSRFAIAYFYQISDRFTNWIREKSIATQLRVCTCHTLCATYVSGAQALDITGISLPRRGYLCPMVAKLVDRVICKLNISWYVSFSGVLH